MFKCMFIKRKLYAYLQDVLREKEKNQIKQHLGICSCCRKEFNQTAELIKAAADKTMPSLPQFFWHDFRAELDEKLNRRLITPFQFQSFLVRDLKPVLVFALVLISILGGIVYKYYSKSYLYADADSQLVDEAVLLDELSPDPVFNMDEDVYLDYL